jgi:hypothetical protein
MKAIHILGETKQGKEKQNGNKCKTVVVGEAQ